MPSSQGQARLGAFDKLTVTPLPLPGRMAPSLLESIPYGQDFLRTRMAPDTLGLLLAKCCVLSIWSARTTPNVDVGQKGDGPTV